MAQKLSFVIPCYRSEHTIAEVVREIGETVEAREQGCEYEIICVNDGSPDHVDQALMTLYQSNRHVVFVNLSRNFGQHSALMAGFREATGDVIVCLDDDGQTPACDCFRLIDKVNEGYDIVYARYAQKQHSGFRNWGSRLNAACSQYFFNQPKGLYTSSYFACKRFVVENATRYENPYPYVTGLLFQSVKTYANVDVVHRARAEGESGYTLKKLVSLWANGVTAFSIKPLRLATVLGIVCSVIGFLFGIVTIIRKIVNPDIMTGWASTISIIVFLGGIVILLMGIIGEYIGRIYLSINNNPQYVVRDVHRHGTDE